MVTWNKSNVKNNNHEINYLFNEPWDAKKRLWTIKIGDLCKN